MTRETRQEQGTMKKRIEEIIASSGDEITIFDLLEPEEIRKVAALFELARYPAGAIVIEEGEKISYLGIIASGEMRLERQGRYAGKWLTLAILSKGAHIGDFSMPVGRESMGQLKAVTDAELLVISHAKLDAFIQENPYTSIKILKGINAVLSIRLKHAIDKVVVLS